MRTGNLSQWNRFLLVALVAASECFGIPARSNLHSVRQPDGTVVRLRVRGDETGHWHEDADGFVVVRDRRTRDWMYAQVDSAGGLTQTVHRVGRVRPESLGLRRGVRPGGRRERKEITRKACLRAPQSAAASSSGTQTSAYPGASRAEAARPTCRTLKNLVVLMEFSDLKFRYSADDFDALYNQEGYTAERQRGSVKDYFKEVSYGRLNLESIVIGPFVASHNYAYYGEASGDPLRVCDLAAEALAAVKSAGFDFSQCDADGDGEIDGFDVIHAGWGAEAQADAAYSDYIWAQSWNLRTPVAYDGVRIETYHTEGELRGEESESPDGITAVGTICHEIGHDLGLPDLYDTDGSSSGAGHFCLMASGSWCGPNDDGTVPCHPSAWCKAYLGWLEPTEISDPGNYGLPQIEDHAAAVRLQGNFTSNQEYFLVENRQGIGFDAFLPGTKRGLLIWHVDETQLGNENERHYRVDLEEASGTQHLELGLNKGDDDDYFRVDTQASFSSSTTPDNLGYRSERLGLALSNIGPSQEEMAFRVEEIVERAGFKIEDGVLLSWDGLGSTDLEIPQDLGVRTIAAQAFYGNARVTSITLPMSVTAIGAEAFRGCGRLTNVVWSSKLTTVGESAFYMCPKLTGRLYLPASVKTVGSEAFALTGLGSAVFMGTPQSLGGAVFRGCRALARVYFKGNAPAQTGAVGRYGFSGLYDGAPDELVSYAPVGSKGWGISSFPATWPIDDGKQTRMIRSYSPTFVVRQAKNDGSAAVSSQVYELGVPKRLLWKDSQLGWSCIGYDFLGWGLSADASEPVCANGESLLDPVDPGETLTLHALWKPVSYTVRLNKNDGSAIFRDQLLKVGQSQRLLWKDSQLAWSRDGYLFCGWMATSGSGLVQHENGELVADLAAVGKTANLYAAWLGAGTYRVVYHRNFMPDDEEMRIDLFKVGASRRLAWKDSQLGWTRSGCTFLGWSIGVSPALATLENGAEVCDLSSDGKTVHLYAVWLDADTYRVVFHRGQSLTDEAVHVQGIRRDQSAALAWFNSQHGWAAPNGKTFLGWSRSASATRADFANGEKVTNLTAGGKTIHLYAVYAQNK